ncbi:MAG: TraB/GumN family protein [Candidatus Nanoarchaeia archaeon]|nr:TraB/GumN family protein [Candidatus Nanoarchaeia archaeon]
MQQYKNLILIGTSHISIESIKTVKNKILEIKPKIVALELDQQRFNSLMYKKKRKTKLSDIRKIGLTGYIFNIMGAFAEKKLGKLVGVSPGSEMKEAAKAAFKVKADLALIDQDITITLSKLSKRLSWKEKFYFVWDLIQSAFSSKKIDFDLKKVPSKKTINKMTAHVKKHYPSIYLTLIKERNEYMAKALYKLMKTYPGENLIAVVGAGHEEEMIELIKKCKD